jgi:hypothetical protein
MAWHSVNQLIYLLEMLHVCYPYINGDNVHEFLMRHYDQRRNK